MLALNTNSKYIFEIGTFKGRNAINLSYNTDNDVVIYTLNRPQNECDFTVGEYIHNKKDPHKIKQLFGNSMEFDFSPYYDKIDLMIVDGNYHYKYLYHDIIESLKCVKNGGFIIVNYFDYKYLGSTKAILDICKKYDIIAYKPSIMPLAIIKKTLA